MTDKSAHRVVIAGAGVAGLEAMVALHELAGDRVAVTVVSPQEQFFFQARSVEDPFARPTGRRWNVADLCSAHRAGRVASAVSAIDPGAGTVTTADGEVIEFDSLLVAVGATRERALEQESIVFSGDHDAEAMHGLIQDVEDGYAKRIAFIVPPGVTWPLPLYELALMTAERAREMNHDDLELTLVTPEEIPLAAFGRTASESVGEALESAGITVMAASYVRHIAHGLVIVDPSGGTVSVDRVVSIPRLHGPAIAGLATETSGFIPVDGECRMRGSENVFAAGDGTNSPVKQGGLAAQQADVAAVGIARRAGIDVAPARFEPTLRARLLTGTRSKYLRAVLTPEGGEQTSTAADHSLWWPPTKVAAPHLVAYLDAVERGGPVPTGFAPPRSIHVAGDPQGGIEMLEPWK